MQKRSYFFPLSVCALMVLVFFSGVSVGDFEKDLFWSRNDDTIVLTNSSHNLMIGKNVTTDYRLEVNGSTYIYGYFEVGNSESKPAFYVDGSEVYAQDDFYALTSLNAPLLRLTESSNQIEVRGAHSTSKLSIPVSITNAVYELPISTGDDEIITEKTSQSISGQKTFSNVITYFSQYLAHMNDVDTRIYFTNDNIYFQSGGVYLLQVYEGSTDHVTINPYGVSMRTIIESDNNNEAFLVDNEPEEIFMNIPVNIDENLTIPYVPNGYDMTRYSGNICINQSTGLLGTKDNDKNWYWR